MTILTNLPVTATCGTPQVVTIDKAQFVTDFGIVDAYWSDPANWQEIEFYYVNSANGLQIKKMTFAGNTYSLNMKTNIWNGTEGCQKITIMDGNGATLAFARASFPVAAEFDFATTGGYSPIVPIEIWDVLYGDVASTGGGELHRTGAVSGWDNSGRSLLELAGDFSFTGIWNVSSINPEAMVGYTKTPQVISPTGPEFDTSLYSHSNQTNLYIGPSNTAVAVSARILVMGANAFEITRVAGIITAKVDGQTIFTDNYSGSVYVGASMYSNGVFSITSASLVSNLWSLFYNDMASTGLGELHRTGGSDSFNQVAYDTVAKTGDFNFSGVVNISTPASDNTFMGYVKTAVPAIDSGLSTNQTSSIYLDTGNVHISTGTGNTAVPTLNPASYAAGAYPFSIVRVAGVITATFNGTIIFIDSYAGTLFLLGLIYSNTSTITSSSVV